MKSLYINVEITDYSCLRGIESCMMFVIKDGKMITKRELTHQEACRVMWQLVGNGASRRVTSNPYNTAIHTTSVTYWRSNWD